jgi:hypothetical protein
MPLRRVDSPFSATTLPLCRSLPLPRHGAKRILVCSAGTLDRVDTSTADTVARLGISTASVLNSGSTEALIAGSVGKSSLAPGDHAQIHLFKISVSRPCPPRLRDPGGMLAKATNGPRAMTRSSQSPK